MEGDTVFEKGFSTTRRNEPSEEKNPKLKVKLEETVSLTRNQFSLIIIVVDSSFVLYRHTSLRDF